MNGRVTQFGRGDGIAVTQYEQGETVGLVADVGAGSDATADIVGDTAIVVVDGEQHEFDVPAGEGTARANNGVVTVEVTR